MECTIDHDCDDTWYSLQCKNVTARKQHKCEECNCTIEKGEEYELYKGSDGNGNIYTCKTCLDCVSIRDAFFTGVTIFGNVIDEVRENIIYELGGEVDSKCIIPLTEKAKERIFGYIEEAWAE